MQPYFFPYVGYFQLISAVDVFIVYDNIKYTKKGWINRNRYLSNGASSLFTVPVAGASDALDIRERQVAASFDRDQMLHRIRAAYHKAPHRDRVMELFERCVRRTEPNLFHYIDTSIRDVCATAEIRTPFIVSSTLDIDPALQAQAKVLAICNAVGATEYLNPIGGRELYDSASFASRGVSLFFLQTRPEPYDQGSSPFVPFLSILDVLMFNDAPAIRRLLHAWDPA